jgi:hypothetical protein
MGVAENAGGGDRIHTIYHKPATGSLESHFPLTIRRLFQGSRASRAICRPERIESGLSALLDWRTRKRRLDVKSFHVRS